MKIYKKIYKTIPEEKVTLISRISKFNNGRYGFETSSDGINFEKNINMPMFWSEQKAVYWIENNKEWQRVKDKR